MKKICAAVIVCLLAWPQLAPAEGTQRWRQSSLEDFQKGTSNGVSISSDGVLEPAPSFRALNTTPSTYLWATAVDAAGNLYAAAGGPARVYRITPTGATTLLLEPQELQVQALAVAPDGTLYAATSPDGKVYKIEMPAAAPAGARPKPAAASTEQQPATEPVPPAREMAVDPKVRAAVFFDPKTKYIWDIKLDAAGNLYVATGDRGEIFRVTRTGESSVFFKSDEAHIRALVFDAGGNLIAGSDGSGLIYQITPAGEGFVVYSAPKKEITALAIDKAGNIYAAGVGEKQPGARAGAAPTSVPMTIQMAPTPQPGPAPEGPPQNPQQPQTVAPPTLATLPGVRLPTLTGGGSEIYRIAADGAPMRLWTSREDIVYTLGFDHSGTLLAGTGNRGRIFLVRPNGDYVDLVKASANQVTALSPAADGGVYVATANLGKVFLLGGRPQEEATFESDVFDAGIFSRWGRVEARGAGNLELYARSGNVDNPDRNWSPWRRVNLEKDAVLDVPPARFIQWRTVLRASAQAQTATRLESVTLYYRPNNVAPVIEEVTVQVGARVQAPPKPAGDAVQVGGSQQRFEVPPAFLRDRSSIAVRWTARDENDDQLVYTLYYRGDDEREWKLLQDDLRDRFYSWDAGLLPDGGYSVRVVASDAPSHSPDEALTRDKVSARFEVDNTPPRVEDLNAALEGEGIRVTFRGTDSFSPIRRAEYSVDAGPWQFVEPVGQLSDSRLEHYDFTIPATAIAPTTPATAAEVRSGRAQARRPALTEHVIVVRVYDWFDNVGTAKAVVGRK